MDIRYRLSLILMSSLARTCSVCVCVRVRALCRECRSWNKGSILRCTVDYVRRLQTQQESLLAMLKKNRQLEQQNQQLRNEVEVSS